nr:uncharacterized protein LOC129266193 [Lytechinus pictus]
MASKTVLIMRTNLITWDVSTVQTLITLPAEHLKQNSDAHREPASIPIIDATVILNVHILLPMKRHVQHVGRQCLNAPSNNAFMGLSVVTSFWIALGALTMNSTAEH